MRRLNLSYWSLAGVLLPLSSTVAAFALGLLEAALVCVALTGLSAAVISLRE